MKTTAPSPLPSSPLSPSPLSPSPLSQPHLSKETSAKDFLAFHRTAVLSTQSRTHQGYPFLSLVPYDLDSTGRVIIYISKIAEHYKNLSLNTKASVFVPDLHAWQDPQPYGRITILGDFSPITEEERQTVKASYEKRFPDSIPHSLSHDFVYFRSTIERVRWISGFGDISWISVESFQSCALDPLSYVGMAVCEHMNADHQDALVLYAKHLAKVEPDNEKVVMVFISSVGFTLQVLHQGSTKRVNILFPKSVLSTSEAKTVLIEMLQECRKYESL